MKSKTIQLLGNKSQVELAHGQVDKFLSHFSSVSTDIDYIKKHHTRKDFLRIYSANPDIIAPAHWKHYNGSLNDMAAPQGHLVPTDDKLRQAVSSLIMNSWNSNLVGQGKDAANLQVK
jgi:hypothetical protein